MSTCYLLRLNTDCLGLVLQYCDFTTLRSLRKTTKESFKRRVNECILDIYMLDHEDDASVAAAADDDDDDWIPPYSAALLSQLKYFLTNEANHVRGLVTRLDLFPDKHDNTGEIISFLSSFDIFFGSGAFRNLRVLEIDASYMNIPERSGIYRALLDAVVSSSSLLYLTQCILKVGESCPDNLRSMMSRHCPHLKLLEICDYFQSSLARDSTQLHKQLLDHYICDSDVWPSLKVLDIGWIYQRVLDEVDGDVAFHMSSQIARRVNNYMFPNVTTLKIKVLDSANFLDVFRAIVKNRDIFLGSQVLVLEVDQGCENEYMSDSYQIQQEWADFAGEVSAAASGSDGRLFRSGIGTRKLPVLFPNLQLIRFNNIIPSSYFFEFISNSAEITIQLSSLVNDPVISLFLQHCYRPGALSPTIRRLFVQTESVYLEDETRSVLDIHSAIRADWPLAGSCLGFLRDNARDSFDCGYIEAMKYGKFSALKQLHIAYHIALVSEVDEETRDERFHILQCISLEHLVIVIGPDREGTLLTEHRCDRFIDTLSRFLRLFAGEETLPCLHTLDIHVQNPHMWTYIARTLISTARHKDIDAENSILGLRDLVDIFRVHHYGGRDGEFVSAPALQVRMAGYQYLTVLSRTHIK